MVKNNLNIERGSYVSKELLLAYLRNQLSGNEKTHFEKLIAEDEFLLDAIEGLKGADLNVIEKSLTAIYSNIDARTNVRKPFSIAPAIKKYAAAAALIFFLGITFLIMDRLNENADNQSEIALEPARNKKLIEKPEDSTNIASDMGGGSVINDSIEMIESPYTSEAKGLANEEAPESEKFEPVIASEFSVKEEIDLSSTSDRVSENSEQNMLFNNGNTQNKDDADYVKTSPAVSESNDIESGEKKLRLFERIENRDKSISKKNDVDDGPVTYEGYQISGTQSSDSVALDISNQLPQYPGGVDSLNVFLRRNIKYKNSENNNTDVSLDNVASGQVFIKFLINEDGSISNSYIITGMGKEYDNEALRVVKLMPKWIPGKKDGVNVKVWYTLVIKMPNN